MNDMIRFAHICMYSSKGFFFEAVYSSKVVDLYVCSALTGWELPEASATARASRFVAAG